MSIRHLEHLFEPASVAVIGASENATRIGGRPILWHIMKIYASHGITDFIVCCGYKGYVIKEFFANYFLHTSDVTFDMTTNQMEIHEHHAEPWRVTLVDTGDSTQTGGRIRRIRRYVENEPFFCMTYGDGVSDIDITAEIAFHRSHGKLATVAAVAPPGRFGTLEIAEDQVQSFTEKPLGDGNLINGGFFVLSPKVLDYIDSDDSTWEQEPLITLAEQGQLLAYKHEGFWQAMDTLREKNLLEELWAGGQAPWKTW